MTFQSGIITKYVIGGSVTSFLFNDTQISVDSSNGLPTTVKLQPIDPSQGKTSVFVQDDGNNCSVGKITIVASAGNLINGSPTLVLDTDGIGVEIAITDQNNFIANLSSGGALPIPNNPYDYYLDGTVAVGGDGSIESPFKTLTELNNAVLLLPPNANIYTANVLPDPSGYGNEVVGTLNIAENLNLIGINAPSTTINCPVKLTSTGLGSGATILQYRNIAFTNVFTVDLSLSTIAFVSFIDGQFNINRIDNNVNGAINMQGGIFSTTISGGVVNLLHSLLFGDITISGGASVYSVDTQLYGGTFKLVGNCTLKTLSTLNPIAGYVDGTVDMSGTPSWITDEASNESYTGTLNRTILGGGGITGADNGLTLSGSDVLFGGNLIMPTVLNADNTITLIINDSFGQVLNTRDSSGNVILYGFGDTTFTNTTYTFEAYSSRNTYEDSFIVLNFGSLNNFRNAIDVFNMGSYCTFENSSIIYQLGRGSEFVDANNVTSIGNFNSVNQTSTSIVLGFTNITAQTSQIGVLGQNNILTEVYNAYVIGENNAVSFQTDCVIVGNTHSIIKNQNAIIVSDYNAYVVNSLNVGVFGVSNNNIENSITSEIFGNLNTLVASLNTQIFGRENDINSGANSVVLGYNNDFFSGISDTVFLGHSNNGVSIIGNNFISIGRSSSPVMFIDCNTPYVTINSMPTSSVGLPSGTLWNNSGVVNVA